MGKPVRCKTFPEQRLGKQINMEEKLNYGENSPSGYLPNKISEAPRVIQCHPLTKPRNLTNLSSLPGGLTSAAPVAR